MARFRAGLLIFSLAVAGCVAAALAAAPTPALSGRGSRRRHSAVDADAIGRRAGAQLLARVLWEARGDDDGGHVRPYVHIARTKHW